MLLNKEYDVRYIPEELYRKIVNVMPIACVDLVVSNPIGEILLLKRKNFPAKGQWWFPGGRVHFMETRKYACLRKLLEECGIKGKVINEIGTFDIILEENHLASHGITSVFQLSVESSDVCTDEQSLEYAWKSPSDWMKVAESDFVKMILKKHIYLDADGQKNRL